MSGGAWSMTVKGNVHRMATQFRAMSKMDYLQEPMKQSLILIRNTAQKAPPQPSRRRSKHFNTWVREVGQLPRSAFGVSSGGKVKINRGGRSVLRKSEMLLKNWKNAQPQVRVGGGYIAGRLVNRVSYASFVQGTKQVKFHAATGWKTATQMQEGHEVQITKLFRDAVQKQINSLG
jgi:hypothetical protein